MPIAPMHASGPTGVFFTFEDAEYHIKPCVLSGETIDILRESLLEMRRDECRKLLRDTKLPSQVRREIIAEQLTPISIRWGDVVMGLSIPKILARFLAIACDIKPAEASHIAMKYEPFEDLMMKAIEAAGIGAIKNSAPPSESGEETNQEQEQEVTDQETE